MNWQPLNSEVERKGFAQNKKVKNESSIQKIEANYLRET